MFRDALARGPRLVRMPRLACMHRVEQRRIRFQDAQNNAVNPDQGKIGPIDRELIERWRGEMKTSFAAIEPWIR